MSNLVKPHDEEKMDEDDVAIINNKVNDDFEQDDEFLKEENVTTKKNDVNEIELTRLLT